MLPPDMGDWALITGASSGIGHELAKLFAAGGFNLALVARNEARLRQVAAELLDQSVIRTKVLPCDLASASAPDQIFDSLRDTPISILVNNAGFGVHGPFAGIDLGVQTDLMQVNMTALVRLTHLFLQPMLARGHGRILNVASTAAFQPGPTVNAYYASKAFVFSFSYALAAELKDTGITVTTLCPGSTRTEFFDRARMPVSRKLPMMEARAVAEVGYRGLMRGKRVVIPGASNKITSLLAKWSPVRLAAAVVAAIHKPGR
jgi:short-subunit dehydrogenase